MDSGAHRCDGVAPVSISQAAKASLALAQRGPASGGNTEFADKRAAYDALEESTRAWLAGKVAVHSYLTSRREFGWRDSPYGKCGREISHPDRSTRSERCPQVQTLLEVRND